MGAPWARIRAEWLKGGITQQELADKYHLSVKTIQNRAYKEGWKKQKGKIAEKTEERTRERIVRARVNHLERLINASELIITGLEKLAASVAEDPVKYLQDKSGSLRSAESITKALQVATETQMELYKVPNIDQKFAAKKWREQMKLEKAKTSEAGGGDGQLMVVIHKPAEEAEADAEA